MSKAVTIRDIARECGCSAYTVSSVLNNKGKISEETRKKVRRTAERLNYDPLRSMPLARKVTPRALALVVPEADAEVNPFYWRAVNAARRLSSEQNHDFKLFVAPDLIARLSDRSSDPLAWQFDGLVAFCSDLPKGCLQRVLDHRIPVALIRREANLRGVVTVLDDDRAGMRLAMEHLHAVHGHTRIGLLALEFHEGVPDTRLAAYRQYVREHGLSDQADLLLESPEFTQAAIDRLVDLVRSGRMTALTCMSDHLAVGAAKVLLQAGLRIPQDVAVIGYNNDAITDMFHPGITTVSIPVEAMVAAACRNLLAQDRDMAPASTVLRFENSLVVRESCGPHAGKPA